MQPETKVVYIVSIEFFVNKLDEEINHDEASFTPLPPPHPPKKTRRISVDVTQRKLNISTGTSVEENDRKKKVRNLVRDFF